MKQKRKRISVTAIDKDLTFSDKSVWLWVAIPPTPYEFLDSSNRVNQARSMDVALAALLTSDEKPLECQLIVTNSPFDSVEWANDLYERSLRDNPNDELINVLNAMEKHVRLNGFRDKKVYLGVKLGTRAEYRDSKSFLPLNEILNYATSSFGVKDYSINEKEIEFWHKRSKLVRNSLQTGHMAAERVYADELAYLIKKPFFPNMVMPPVDVSGRQDWGTGELDYLTDGLVENHAKHLKITQELSTGTEVGYRATLCFSKFPETLMYPQQEPWIHFSSSLPFPVDFYSRFTLEPSRKVKKEVTKKLAEVKDQAQNMTSAGGSVNIDIMDRMQEGLILENELNKGTEPWVYARHRISIEAPSEEILKERTQQLIDHYKDLNIQVVAPTGDQMSLMLEGMPNDEVRVQAYYQRQQISIISAGTPSGSSSVGNQKKRLPNGEVRGFLGPYIGYTTSRVLSPVFFSQHSTLAAGESPGVIITGSSGSGKSNLAFTLTYYMALMGTSTVYIDPKGEATTLTKLPGLDEGQVRVFDLEEGVDGILDPFVIGENLTASRDLANQLIEMFLKGKVTSEQNVEISNAIDLVSDRPDPSLGKIVRFLAASTSPAAKEVATILKFIQELPFARLCFAKGDPEKKIEIAENLTLITLKKLNLPPVELAPENYENSHRLAVAIMFLLTTYTRDLMYAKSKTAPKAIVIDEAWAVTSTPQGLRMALEVARTGRHLNTALFLVSQNSGDFKGDGIENNVSTKIAFRAKTKPEQNNILEMLGLEKTEANRSIIGKLQIGECIIKDGSDRLARVKIDVWNKDMMRAFESNPEKRRRQEEEEQQALALS